MTKNSIDEDIAMANREMLIAALRMCRQAIDDYLTMSKKEGMCIIQFVRCRDAIEQAISTNASAPRRITTEALDVAQFGRVLHNRPRTNDND